MRHHPKILLFAFVAIAAVAIMYQFAYKPHHLFHLGMGVNEVNHALGKKVELVPLNSALRLENLEKDMKTVPMYSLWIKSMATTIYFNSHTQVVRIE